MKQIEEVTVKVLTTEAYNVACLYIREIRCFEDMCEEELEDYGESDYYVLYSRCLAFYRQQLEDIKPIIREHHKWQYDKLEEIGWKDHEELVY
jgi:hypothetical protein